MTAESLDAVPSTSPDTSHTAPPSHPALPYWLTNIPLPSPLPDPLPPCPAFLLHANAKDQGILAQPDSSYQFLSWPEVLTIIRPSPPPKILNLPLLMSAQETNRLDLFRRKPSDLRRYKEYIYQIKQSHGSVMAFVLSERLQWVDLTPANPLPFTDPSDIKILPNDWPYGLDPSIVHLVVWTKFALDDDPETDDLTPEARELVEGFVDETFRREMPAGNVVWFKNWGSLKSVRSVEHFHVLLLEPEREKVERWTGGVRALCDVVRSEQQVEKVE